MVGEDQVVHLVVVVFPVNQEHFLLAGGRRNDDQDKDALAIRFFTNPEAARSEVGYVLFRQEKIERLLVERDGLCSWKSKVRVVCTYFVELSCRMSRTCSRRK